VGIHSSELCIQGKIKISLCFCKLLHEYLYAFFILCMHIRLYTITPGSFVCIYMTYYLRLMTQWLTSRGFPGLAYRSVCSISPSPLEPLASCGKCCHFNAYSKMSIFSMHVTGDISFYNFIHHQRITSKTESLHFPLVFFFFFNTC